MKKLRQYLENDYRKSILKVSQDCISFERICDYSEGSLPVNERQKIESHISRCYHCLDALAAIHDGGRRSRRGPSAFKREHFYLLLSIVSFSLSFTCSRYFLQFLAATLLLGIKWIIDSKTTKTLVMINEAWKREKGPESVRDTTGPASKKRINL